MANLLEQRRANSEDILQGRFIRKVLTEVSQDMDKAQREKMSGFNSSFWNNRSFTITDSQLDYRHLKQHRYVDMRSRMVKGERKNKKSHAIHNRIIMGHYSEIIKHLKYGFTDAVKHSLLDKL